MDLRGARALVTGASSGIGAATGRVLAAGGVRLALSGRRSAVLEELADEIAARGAPRPVVLPVDLHSRGAAAELGARASEALGGVDILVNSAGDFATGSAASDDASERELFETNYWAPMALTRSLLPGMLKQGRGAVANLSSIATATPLPSMGCYPASKAALTAATEALRIELAGTGVNVLLVFLGGVDTPMHERASRPYGSALRWMPLGRPEVAARLICAAIRHERTTVIYPRSVATIRWLPTISSWVSSRLMLPLLLGRGVSSSEA
jgi:uncharacterized protein